MGTFIMNELSSNDFAPVMDYPDNIKLFDLSEGYDPAYIRSFDWGIGKYDEKRQNMYLSPQYRNKPTSAKASVSRRNIHMGIDIWTEAESPVYTFSSGTVAYMQDNDRPGDYGPTVVLKHLLDDKPVFALFGHLSEKTLDKLEAGQTINKGEKIAAIGSEEINGGWAPHLHFQLSVEDPGEADMPGVVAEEDHEEALKLYPDPRLVLGDIY